MPRRNKYGRKRTPLSSLLARWENLKQRFYNNLEKQILETREDPNKVSMGCALGIGVNFFPTLGFGFIIAFLLATLFKLNRASATLVSLLTGPLIPIMYALNFVSGGMILAGAEGEENLIEFVLSQYALFLKVGRFQEQLLGALELLGGSFLVGALINAAIFGTAFYLFVNYILTKKMKVTRKYRLK